MKNHNHASNRVSVPWRFAGFNRGCRQSSQSARVFRRSSALAGILWLTFSIAIFAQSDFGIGAGDLLDIQVLGIPDFSREVRVDAAGYIYMPYIGQVKLLGLTPAQAQERLADLLHPEYANNPQVSVIIKEARSRAFSVIGAVNKPDQYRLLQPITLIGAIAQAGGLNFAKAGDVARIQRNSDPAGTTFQIEVNLRKLLMEGDMSLDIPIQPGDIINIPVRQENFIYVIGDVTRPGSFDYPAEKSITLTRALAMAGGPTKTSKLKDAALIRQRPDGTIERTHLNLDKILKGKLPDVALNPNDLLYVPGSVEKNLGWSMIQHLPYMLTWAIIP